MTIILIQIYGIFMCVVIANWVNAANEGKVSRHNISLIFSLTGISIIFFIIFGTRSNYFQADTSIVFFVSIAVLFFIVAIVVQISPTVDLLNEAKVWLRWFISLMTITYLITLVFSYPKTKKELEAILLPTAALFFTIYYPIIKEKLNKQ